MHPDQVFCYASDQDTSYVLRSAEDDFPVSEITDKDNTVLIQTSTPTIPLRHLPIRNRSLRPNRAGPYIHPTEMTGKDWFHVLNRTQALSALRMDIDGHIELCLSPAFRIRSQGLNLEAHSTEEVFTMRCTSRQAKTFVDNQFVRVVPPRFFPFVGDPDPRVFHSSEETSPTTFNHEQIYGFVQFQRAILHLTPDDVEPTTEFVAAIEEALAHGTESSATGDDDDGRTIDAESQPRKHHETPREALVRVFRRFGHLWPQEVTLGGKITYSWASGAFSDSAKAELQRQIEAHLRRKVGRLTATGGAESVALDNIQLHVGNQTVSVRCEEHTTSLRGFITFTDTADSGSAGGPPRDWLRTVNDHTVWDVVRRERI